MRSQCRIAHSYVDFIVLPIHIFEWTLSLFSNNVRILYAFATINGIQCRKMFFSSIYPLKSNSAALCHNSLVRTQQNVGRCGVWAEKSNIPKNTLVFAHFFARKIVSQENNISERFIFTGARIYLYKGSKEGRSDGEENWQSSQNRWFVCDVQPTHIFRIIQRLYFILLFR